MSAKNKKKEKKIKVAKAVRLFFRLSTFLFIVAIISCLLITAYYAIITCDYFAINKIIIENKTRLLRQELLTYAKIREGDNIFAVNIGKACMRLNAHPWIEKAAIRRELPGKIIITIK